MATVMRVDITADADQLVKQLKRSEASIDRLKDQNKKLREENKKVVASNKSLGGSFADVTKLVKKFAGPLGLAGAGAGIAAFVTSSS